MARRSTWKRGLVKTRLPSIYKFQRFVSTGQAGITVNIGTSSTGLPSFSSGLVNAQTLQMDFALDAYRVYLGGIQVAAVVVPAYTEFGSLFDKWKIDFVEVFYTSSMAFNGATGAQQSFYMPGIAYAVDTDDANSTGVTDLQQFGNCKYTQLGGDQAGMKLLAKFKPLPSIPMYTTGSTVGGAADLTSRNFWLDAGTPSIKHYGLKMAIDQLNVSQQTNGVYAQLNFQVRYHLSFKDVR